MDPLSITASSIAIITICSQVTNIVTSWISNVRNIDSTLSKLSKEIGILYTVLAAVREIFERPGLATIIELNAEAQLWPCISDILDNCRRTLRKLRRTLRELDTEAESANVVQKGVKHVRLGNRKGLITTLLDQVHSYHGMLQMMLQCTNISISLHESMHNRAADAEILRQLSTIKSEIHELRYSNEPPASPDKYKSEQHQQRTSSNELDEHQNLDHVLENTIHSVEDFVDDSVSTVYARSSNCSEASWVENGKHPVLEHSRGPELATFTTNKSRTTTWTSSASKLPSRQQYRVDVDDLVEAVKSGINQSRLKEKAYLAILGDKQAKLRQLIREGYNPKQHDLRNGNMFCLAAERSKASTVEILLHAGADVDSECYGGLNALACALRCGKDETALMLIRHGAKMRYFPQQPPLPNIIPSLAAMSNCLEALKVLLAAGSVLSLDGSIALTSCSMAGRIEAARVLCDCGVDPEAREPKGLDTGWTALMFACTGGRDPRVANYPHLYSPPENYRKLVGFLLERGANVNAMALQSKMTPLRVAIKFKNVELIPILLKYGVKIDLKSRLWLLAHAKELGLELDKQEHDVRDTRR